MCAAPELQGRPVDPSGEIVAEFLSSPRLFQGAEQRLSDKVAPHVQAVGLSSGTDIVQAGTTIGLSGVLFSGRASIRMVNAVSGEETPPMRATRQHTRRTDRTWSERTDHG